MKRKIISIDAGKCNGCGLCAQACHERAIEIINGKARLVSDEYCDGLGDCLPACPTGAITIVEREAAAYDEAAVRSRIDAAADVSGSGRGCRAGCPGQAAKTLKRDSCQSVCVHDCGSEEKPSRSELRQWPVQLALLNPAASYLNGVDLLIAADCTAYAYADMHKDYLKGRITVIACPKLDRYDYSGKLAEIFRRHNIRSVTVLRMEVPCCGGLVQIVRRALLASEASVPLRVITVGTDGAILEAREEEIPGRG
ncbi:MAG: ATP-binding protein [bacterium]|jgi:Fe-S-cluster-containing hydrogenase component 2